MTTGWIFDISLLCENSINQNTVGQKPTAIILYLALIAIVLSHIQRMPTRKKLLYKVADPARGLLNGEMYTEYNSSAYAIPVAYSFLNVRMYGQHFQQSVIWINRVSLPVLLVGT